MASDRRITLAVDGIEGFWTEPPDWFSFSSVVEGEACPRRWSLRRAAYPVLWVGNGYPDLPHLPALMGVVIHKSLETIIGALVRSGCTSTQDVEAVSVLRSLGGYSAVIRMATGERVLELENNPRCRSRLDYISRELNLRSAEMRRTAQSVPSRSSFAAGVGRPHSVERATQSESQLTSHRYLSNGSYTEMSLRSAKLRMAGRADLVTLNDGVVHIMDYKAGKPTAHHAEQFRLYALLWFRRDGPDPARPYATRLTLSYPNHDVEVHPPSADELNTMETETVARLKDLCDQLAADPPEARPDEEECRYCPVRQLCDPYWRAFATDVLAEGFSDLRDEVIEESGPRSWRLRLDSGEEVLLSVSDATTRYDLGSWLRILSVALSPGADASPNVASVVATSEVFIERQLDGCESRCSST